MTDKKEDLEQVALLKAVEAASVLKTQEALDKYTAEVDADGKATKATIDDLKKASESHDEFINTSKESIKIKFQELEQKISDGFSTKGERIKTLGEQFVTSDDFLSFKNGERDNATVKIKNTILTVSGSPLDPDHNLVAEDRLAGIVPLAFRRLNLLDIIPTGTTTSDTIKFAKEATNTNAAVETADGAAKPESTITFTSAEEFVRTIPTWLKVSNQALDDAPFLASFINTRMGHMVRQRLQLQILNGNGTSPNLSGITDTGNFTAYSPTSGDNLIQASNRAKYDAEGADYTANTIVLNPATWGALEILTRTSSEDTLILGESNAVNYVANGMIPQLWGMNVILMNDMSATKLLVLDINAVQLFMRDNLTVRMFEQDDTNVQSNLMTIRAELRAAFAVYVPLAIYYGDITV